MVPTNDSPSQAATALAAVLRTSGGHVTVERAVAGVPSRMTAGRRRTMCGLGGNAQTDAVCPRCRVGLIRLLGHVLRAVGGQAAVQVDDDRYPARVVRALGLPLLARAVTSPTLPDGVHPGLRWMTMTVPGSRQTHIALHTAAVHDPIWDRWWVASVVQPRMSACLRIGRRIDDADTHPDALCAACAASRDRTTDLLRGWAVPVPGQPLSCDPTVILAPGDDLQTVVARRDQLLVVAALSVTPGGHAHLARVLRGDATMRTAQSVNRLASSFPGRPTLCGDHPDAPTTMLTAAGGCRRCAGAIGRLAATLTRQWPLTRPAIFVDGRVVPTVVLGGTRSRLGDPVLLPRIRRVKPGEAFADCVSPTRSQADDRLHLGWSQRAETEPDFGCWCAQLPHPVLTLCDLAVGRDVAAAHSSVPAPSGPAGVCRICISRALHPTARYGRYGADPDAQRIIAGRTYDRSLVDLLGEDFVVEMVVTNLLETA